MPADLSNPTVCTPETSTGLSILLSLAAERRKLMGGMALAIALLSLAIALLMPNRYTATVVILPPQQSSPPGAAMMAQLGNLGAMASAASGLSIKNPNDQQVALLKSRTVEDAVAARFHLQELYHRKYLSSTRKHWESVTKADNGLKDGLIRLSVTDHDPRRAADLANGWVDEYRHICASLAITEASQRRLFFERQLDAAHHDLTRAEEEMKETEQRTGVIELEGQARAMIASASVLRAQVAAKQVEIQAMRQFAADQNPDLERARQELRGMEGQLASMDVASDRQTGDLVTPKGRVTQASLDYMRALREVKYRETILELLTRQYEAARVDEAREGSLVQIVDAAAIPDRPTPFRLWILLGGLAAAIPLSLLAGLAAQTMAILRRYRRGSDSWVGAIELALAGGWR